MIRRALPLVLAGLLAGCAGAGFNGAAFQSDVAAGNVDRALASLEAFPEDDVSALLDRALLLQERGDRSGSNAAFEAAELRIADLYTRSLSKEALSLLTSDRALDYRAAAHEHAYIAYFRSWNYLEAGDREGVLVEARRIGERLDYLKGSCADEDGACGQDVFLRYWSGLLYEWGGEWNDAYVAYKLADEARGKQGTRPAGETPRDLGIRLASASQRLGFADEARRYCEAYALDPAWTPPPDQGSLVLVWENGLVGRREETGAVIPILKGETSKIREDRETWYGTLAARRAHPVEDVELDYLLRTSLPVFVESPPRGAGARWTVDGTERNLVPVAPLNAMSRDALDRAMGGITVRAIARGLAKYLAKEAAEDEIGKGAGLLVNLLGVALESSDTRSWRTLPYEIRLEALPVGPGTHASTLAVLSREGRPVDEAHFDDVRVAPGGIRFLRHRTAP